MKKIMIGCLITAAMYACNNSDTATKTESKEAAPAPATTETPVAADNTDSPEFQKGLELVRG